MTFDPIDIVLAVLTLSLAAVAITGWTQRRRSGRLKSRFAPEPARITFRAGDEREAETLWAERQTRISGEIIPPLSAEMRNHFIATWRAIQVQFVHSPRDAVSRADDLLGEVMTACGFPVQDFAQRAKALSVDHADIVQHYRTAHAIATNRSRGAASPDNLRMAIINFGALFDDLVNEPVRFSRQPVAPGSRS